MEKSKCCKVNKTALNTCANCGLPFEENVLNSSDGFVVPNNYDDVKLGSLFGIDIYAKLGNSQFIKKEQLENWFAEADKAKRELDYIRSMSDLEKRVFNKQI